MNPLQKRIRGSLLAIDGMIESEGAFGHGQAFWVNGKQVAHFDGSDTIELRITRAVFSEHRDRLKGDARVMRHSASSDWIDVRFSAGGDVALVIELAELAAAAHRAARGTTPKPPPEGADLARRKRFH
ncbi:MAG: luciferase family protein [Dehalococcoidia bacterium]